MKLVPSTIGRRYGWRRAPLPNLMLRSQFMGDNDLVEQAGPRFIDSEHQPGVLDQEAEGSCTYNSASGAIQHLRRVLGHTNDFVPSRQLGYYLERREQGSDVTQDTGSSIAESVMVSEQYGFADEKDWPYDQEHFSLSPTPEILAEAAKTKILTAQQVAQSLVAWKTTIAQHRSVMLGFTVYESFESQQFAKDGLMPLPSRWESVLGGHAVRAYGWDDTVKGKGWIGAFLCRNSWSARWGLNGDFWMPFKFAMSRSASDFHRLDAST